ncbi:PMS1 protein homolog 1-like [Rhopilema esculentum]|uniref:PMS1 protein homolog 1-like n=1 Tax=Rhopilema esculentum TaxID=499914 RepID=UPI0031D32F7E
MKKLSKETIQLISSTQVITSVYSAVKELVENSIDAGSTNIEVRLENFGLGRIEVLDNGCGIAVGDEEFVAKPHYTSKLVDDIGLRTLSTLGFRGEALHSLATVSNLSFSTKTGNQQIGKMFFLDSNGSIIKTRPCSRENGVNMIAENLFKNLPVRRQFYSCVRKNKEELKKIEHLLISYGLIRPELRVVLKHNKSIIWQKSKHQTTKDSFISVFGTACFGQMKEGTVEDKSGNITIRFLLPRKDCVETLFRASNDRTFVFVNERLVEIKTISQVCMFYLIVYFIFYYVLHMQLHTSDLEAQTAVTRFVKQYTSSFRLCTSYVMPHASYIPLHKAKDINF